MILIGPGTLLLLILLLFRPVRALLGWAIFAIIILAFYYGVNPGP